MNNDNIINLKLNKLIMTETFYNNNTYYYFRN